ncbi:MAG: RluA family pseudouridine synthase [Deltaproteobacteria bacterium HGW-Deltaproteobacteria-12]|jgi:23S rRNA pseudouridine1911/1915/1917 synthase|nr:MAG: RluA family pseudouridine synthase [Deltaproteobacteria bacterium HGW-Deltaproteobacteria-12]
MSPEIKIKENQTGQRLDIFLPQNDPSLSRSRVKRMIEEGDVLVNSLPSKPAQRLQEGDIIRLTIRSAQEAAAIPQEIPLNIVYEDAAIIVVNKAAGMVVHPAPGNYDRTLVNALLFHCHDLSGIGGVLRPGIVHRLDKGTSGLIVAAKTDEAHRSLTDQFVRHDVHKTYQAVVWGDVKGNSGEIILAVGRHPGDRKKMSTRSKRGRDAVTLWKVRERYGLATLLDVEIMTGRTHQIRVHLSDRGYPVIGDTVYGNAAKIRTVSDSTLKAQIKAQDRQALHAAKLSFLHPSTHNRIVFTAEMPEDMNNLCAHLRRIGK